MYFYREKSDAKVFHITSCGCFKRLKKGTRKHFSTLEEAEKAGYRKRSAFAGQLDYR